MLSTIQSFFEKVVHNVENNKTPFFYYIFLFLSLLVLRLTLEFISNQKLFNVYDVIHISLWFIFIVLAFLIQLFYFSGESILKVSKLVITFFSISLTAPVIDLIIFKGQGVKMNYLTLNSWDQLLFNYFTIGGSNYHRGATIGIRIEIVLLVLASFNYVRTKTRNLFRSFLAGFSIYTILFLSGIVPFLLSLLVNTFNLKYAHDDLSTILLFLVIDFILLSKIVYKSNEKISKFIFNRISLFYCLIYLALFIWGAYLCRIQYSQNWILNPTTIFYFPLIICLSIFLILISTIFRIKHINGIAGINKLLVALTSSILIVGLSINFNVLFVLLLILSFNVILYKPPLNFSKIKWIKILLLPFIYLFYSLLGFVSLGGPLIGFPFYVFILQYSIFLISIFLVSKK